eukprot:99876-Chlamydomonas_euryale.AAC.1
MLLVDCNLERARAGGALGNPPGVGKREAEEHVVTAQQQEVGRVVGILRVVVDLQDGRLSRAHR